MKILTVSFLTMLCAVSVAGQAPAPQPGTVKLRGCLQGDGSPENPWVLAGVVLPAPVTAPAAPAGRGGGRGARGAPAAAATPAPPQPQVSLRLSGMNLSPWRDMRVELEGSLAGAAAKGLQEFRVVSARSAYGQCPAR